MTTASTRTRGRPSDARVRRQQILEGAATQIGARRTLRLKLRDIADAAGVTPALLHYYFEDLDGLVAGLLRERGEPLLRPLIEELDNGSGAAMLSRFVQKWTALAARQPWLPICMLHTSEPVQWQSALGAALHAAVVRAQQEGSVRKDLPPDYIALLVLVLGTLPQCCGTPLGSGLRMSSDPASAAQLTLLHLSMLQQGVAL